MRKKEREEKEREEKGAMQQVSNGLHLVSTAQGKFFFKCTLKKLMQW